jgi:hypothetical protein
MTQNCEAFIESVLKGQWNLAFQMVDKLRMEELLRAIAALDAFDRDDLWAKRAESAGSFSLPRFEYAWAVVKDKAASNPPAQVAASEVADAQRFIADPTPLDFTRDLTDTLPMANPNPPRLAESDYGAAAASIGCEISAIMAVAQVEAGGRHGFAANGLPIIRYELHQFHKQTGGKYRVLHDPYDLTHPHLSEPTLADGERCHSGRQATEWSLLYGAMILRDANKRRRASEALSSASWGMFQVMGFNGTNVGWNDVGQFATDMFASEGNHLRAFVGYVGYAGLSAAIVGKNWTAFAEGYNGPDYAVNNYDDRIKAAYTTIRTNRVARGLPP